MKRDYSKYPNKDLEKELKQLKIRYLSTFGTVEQKQLNPELRPNIRKEIARIKTEQTKRKNKENK